LRNGETLWVKEDISISALKSEEYVTRAQGEPIVGYHPYILSFGSTFKKYSAQSGDLICDVPALRVSAYDNNRYAYSTQTISGQNYLIKWDTHDITEDFSKRIVYNVTYPLAGITGIWNDVGFYFGTGSAGVGTEELANIRPSGSFDLETGDILWTKNFTYNMTAFTGSANVLADGKYIYPLYSGEWDPENALRLMTAIDLYNGDQVWIGEPPDYPWGSFWCYSRAAAYGLAYFPSYTGYIIAYNTTTGEIEWKGGHSGSVGYETPYGYQPFFSSILVADHKVFAGNNEHSEGPPYYTGKKLWALDAHTGETIWNISFWLPGFGIQGIVADSMFIGTNYYDGRIYAFGKGSSETTVSIQNDVISHGNSVMIKGTVMDIAPATTQDVQVARFPNGVPAVSDESMSEWMEYVYMQKPKPTNATGVDVFLKVLDPNGEYYGVHVTTDEKGRFSHMWTPGVVGEYHVTAMFEGSESYYPSEETTVFGVDQAPAEYPQPPTAEEIADMTADRTVSKLPAYPDVPSAAAVAQETISQLPAYPESPEIPDIPAYLTIDLVILVIAAIGVVIGLIVYMALRKQK